MDILTSVPSSWLTDHTARLDLDGGCGGGEPLAGRQSTLAMRLGLLGSGDASSARPAPTVATLDKRKGGSSPSLRREAMRRSGASAHTEVYETKGTAWSSAIPYEPATEVQQSDGPPSHPLGQSNRPKHSPTKLHSTTPSNRRPFNALLLSTTKAPSTKADSALLTPARARKHGGRAEGK